MMITKQDDLLGTLIHDVAHLLRHEIDRRLKMHNLTRVKWLALGIISKRPHLTQAELAEEMELGNAAVGRLIDRLGERGFVVRDNNPEDRRAYRLMVTGDALRLLDQLEDTATQLRRDLLQGVKEEQIGQLNAVLGKLKANLKHGAVLTITTALVSLQKFESELCASAGAFL